jgi:C-terminal processing protease CtpA/Prc
VRENNESLQNNYATIESTSFREVSVDEDLISITITKREGYNGFGMSLAVSNPKSNKSSFPVITSVDANSPADVAGLKKNDELVEINGYKTIQQQDSKISGFIKSSGATMKILVRRKRDKAENRFSTENEESDGNRESSRPNSSNNIFNDDANKTANNYMNENENEVTDNSQNYENVSFKANKIEMSSSKIQPNSPKLDGSVDNMNEPVPRLCRVRSYGSNLGFFVLASKKKLGVFKVSEVSPNSPAFHSGLRNGDFIIEINGINVQSMTYDDLIKLIKAKKEEDNLQMLVADDNTVEWFANRNTPINSSMVKKLTYIETILQDEMDKNIVDSLNTTKRESQSSLDDNSERIDDNNEAD